MAFGVAWVANLIGRKIFPPSVPSLSFLPLRRSWRQEAYYKPHSRSLIFPFLYTSSGRAAALGVSPIYIHTSIYSEFRMTLQQRDLLHSHKRRHVVRAGVVEKETTTAAAASKLTVLAFMARRVMLIHTLQRRQRRPPPKQLPSS